MSRDKAHGLPSVGPDRQERAAQNARSQGKESPGFADDHESLSKLSCHSDYVDPDVARKLQEQRLVQINTAPAHNLPTQDTVI